MKTPTLQTRNCYSSLSVDPIPSTNLSNLPTPCAPTPPLPSVHTPWVWLPKRKDKVQLEPVPAVRALASLESTDNGSSNTKTEAQTEDRIAHYAAPFSALWTLRRIQEVKTSSVGVLRNWVHKKRHSEATQETVQEIASLEESDALFTLKELAEPKKYVRGHRGGRQMDVSMVLSSLDDERDFKVDALLDTVYWRSLTHRSFLRIRQHLNRKIIQVIISTHTDPL